MAQFDLKNADIYINDGYVATGAINNASGYAIGATTAMVDDFDATESAAIAVGNIFTFAGHGTQYTITNVTLTLNLITSISFTPPLTAAVTQDEVINVGPHRLKIKVGEGNLNYSEKVNRQYIKDRGKLDTVRDGDEEPVDVRLEFQWQYLTNTGVAGAVPTPSDALKKTGPAANWISSAADLCEPYAVDIEIFYTPLCVADKKERILLQDFRYEELAMDLKAGQISVTGKCNRTQATLSRVA